MNVTKTSGSSAERVVSEALRAIGALFERGDVIEIRALCVGRTPQYPGDTQSGYFNFENSSAIAAAIRSIDGKSEGVFVVLNRLNPELLARSDNRLQSRPKHTSGDADIIEWRWLYIDVDAIRPAGISATDTEHHAALARVQSIREFLERRGWPEPIDGDSGNGGHLLYRLPALDLKRAGDLVKRCLKALSARFSDSIVKVDESTATAARLCKLYGTLVRKGDSTAGRPHRRSALLDVPERIEPVPEEALEALASEVPVATPTNRTERTLTAHSNFDIGQWLAKGGLEVVKGPEPYSGGGWRWTLRACPFNPAHEKPVVIELAGGARVFKCLHTSCSENDWTALRRCIEPDYQEWREQPQAVASAAANSTRSQVGISTNDVPLITDLSQIPSVFSLEAQLTWCVESMIAQGSVTLICAESGTGKTWLGYYLAGCVAHGLPVLNLPVRRSKVLYLDGENPLCVAKQRLCDLGISETPDLIVWGGWNLSPPVGPGHPLVTDFARNHKGLIIYDSLIEFHSGSEQSSTETRAFMRHFRALANLGATVVVLHHTGKAQTSKQYRGSSDIKAVVDIAYLLARTAEDTKEMGQLSMTCFKGRLALEQDFGLTFKKGEGFISCEKVKPFARTKAVLTEILRENPASNQTKVVRLGQIRGCTKRQLESSLRSGSWIRHSGPKNSTLYSVPEEAEDEPL